MGEKKNRDEEWVSVDSGRALVSKLVLTTNQTGERLSQLHLDKIYALEYVVTVEEELLPSPTR